MTDTSHTKYILANIFCAPRAEISIFLILFLVFVVGRITHVALPCELTEKLAGSTVRA